MVAVPGWLALGLAIAAGLTVLFAVVFVLGERLFPTAPVEGRAGSDGERKRRAEIRSYLDGIEEPYVEDRAIAGHDVAFFLPDRGVAITFDGVAYFRLERAGTTTILVEHEMPGAHLGARLPFETPDWSRGHSTGADATYASGRSEAGPGEDSVRAAFGVLGVSPDADQETIKAAYRERIKEVHPDHGGDEETFRRVREAYTAAKQAAA